MLAITQVRRWRGIGVGKRLPKFAVHGEDDW